MWENGRRTNFIWTNDAELDETKDENAIDDHRTTDDNGFVSSPTLTMGRRTYLRQRHHLLWTVDKDTENVENVIEKEVNVPTVNNMNVRCNIIKRIESIALSMIKQICSGTLPAISYPVPCQDFMSQMCDTQSQGLENVDEKCTTMPDETTENDNDSQILGGYSERMISVNFAHEKSRDKLALMATVMAKAHLLLLTRSTVTRRCLYYELKSKTTARLAPSQRYVDQSVNNVASLLECAPWDLRLLPTSKGLIAGDITIELMDGKTICCDVPGGALIPQVISEIVFLRARAKFVLVVEKDTVFQTLLEERCPEKLNCILITGKGYPDIATRMLLKLISEQLVLPVYILVDADPFGVDIMCVYRFGSLVLSKANDSLACPAARWLGIHPTELDDISASRCPLTDVDLTKLASIGTRHYVSEDLRREMLAMARGKLEIEAISARSKGFLTDTYLPAKVAARKYV